MHKTRNLTMLAGAACALLVATGCASSSGGNTQDLGEVAEDCVPTHEFETVKPGVLTVVPYEFMPYASVVDGELVGVDGKVISEFEERQCLTVSIMQLPAASALESIATNQTDLALGGWYKSPERAEQFGETLDVYYDFSALISAEENSFSKLDDLKDKKIALVQGQSWVDDVIGMYGADNVTVYQTPDAAIAEVQNGRADAAFVGAAEGSVILGKKEGLALNRIEPDDRLFASQEVYAINYPHAKTNTQLGEALDANIEEMRNDGSIEGFLVEYDLTDPDFFGPH